jgi:Ca-activated chloride channel homolog
MRFADPDMLSGFWIVPLLVLFLFWAIRRKQNLLNQFAQKELLTDIAVSFDARKERRKHIFVIFSVILSILALARPQWGFQWQEVNRQAADIFIAIDTSKSMLTQDVKPSRLARTKLAVKDLMNKLQGDRIGLMAFSGNAFLVCPLTIDYGGFLLSLEDLDIETIPRGGTNIAGAITAAIKEYDKSDSKDKAVVILTDGENLEGDPISAAQQAKVKGIKVYCVGIGTQEGELIQVPIAQGQLEFLKDENGNFVKSRLNEKLLQQIALTTGGIYVRASGAEFGLDLIYDRELSKMEKREIESKMEKKYFERFQVPLSLALFFLVLGTIIGTRKTD